MQTQKVRGKRNPGINPVIYVWEHKAIASSNWPIVTKGVDHHEKSDKFSLELL